MFYSESLSESDFNLPSDSESDFSSVFMNLDICIFLPYVFILLNKPGDEFFIYFQNRINSYACNASIMHIFFWQKSLFLSHHQISLL